MAEGTIMQGASSKRDSAAAHSGRTTMSGHHISDGERALIESLSALAPILSENAALAEQQRKPVDTVMQAIEDTGAYRWFVPKKYGGYEYSLSGFMEVGIALGEGCTSHAWVTTFCMEHNWLLALYDQAAQDDLFG
ncbi:MAG: hypothetical protein V2I41_05500, partial [Pseudomonadales bacterium]|nr:hypothetical protein [Pseudomonadales bacterium]